LNEFSKRLKAFPTAAEDGWYSIQARAKELQAGSARTLAFHREQLFSKLGALLEHYEVSMLSE
jgi:hypothetical protein